MRAFAVAVITGLLGFGALTACGSDSTPGTADPQPSSTPTTPSRPKTIRLDGLDPCLIPQSDATRFQLEGDLIRQTNKVFGVPECFYGAHFGNGSISLGIKEGVDVWLAGKYVANIHRTTPVLGFPAINVTIDADPGRCDVLVDVAPHEYLKASTNRSDIADPTIPAEPCVWSRQWAEAAMSTLLSQH
jgi:hypothetical protein